MSSDTPRMMSATWIKLENRRVCVARFSDGDFGLMFKKLRGYRDIAVTNVKLSKEATEAMMQCLLQELDTRNYEFQGYQWKRP